MPVQRGYRQACGIARGLDLVGERWALLIVRELLLGPKRFTDLRAGLPGASPNALTDRTARADAGRRPVPPAAPRAGRIVGLRAHRLGPRARAGRARAGHLGARLAAGRRAQLHQPRLGHAEHPYLLRRIRVSRCPRVPLGTADRRRHRAGVRRVAPRHDRRCPPRASRAAQRDDHHRHSHAARRPRRPRPASRGPYRRPCHRRRSPARSPASQGGCHTRPSASRHAQLAPRRAPGLGRADPRTR